MSFLTAWLTILLRGCAILFLCAYLILGDSQHIKTTLDIGILYVFVSLITNCFLLLGMLYTRPHYMLPHLVVLMFEMFFVIYCLFFGIGLLLSIHFLYLMPTAAVVVAGYLYMWSNFVRKFHQLETGFGNSGYYWDPSTPKPLIIT